VKKIFISSVVKGMEELRDAAERGIRALDMDAVRSERFGAQPDSPQRVCLEGVRESDGMVLLIGARYGDPQASGRSPTHEEYVEARERVPVLVFVQGGVKREPQQEEFLREVRGWDIGHSTVDFEGLDQLQEVVTRNLYRLDTALSRGPANESELLERCAKLVPQEQSVPQVVVAVVGSPFQEILRPAEIEEDDLADGLMQSALFGKYRVLDPAKGTQRGVSGHTLCIAQEGASVTVSESGDISVAQSSLTATGRDASRGALVEEDLMTRIATSLSFAAFTLDTIDSRGRISDVCLGAALLNSDYVPWFTRAEAQQRPESWITGQGRQRSLVHLSPPVRKRSMLGPSAQDWAEDLITLIRREHKAS